MTTSITDPMEQQQLGDKQNRQRTRRVRVSPRFAHVQQMSILILVVAITHHRRDQTNETDLQLGGGYIYQWECAILLALNYFFEPVHYNPTLSSLVQDFLGQVEEMYLEGTDRESGVDLEDISLTGGGRCVLVQVKAKQAEGEHWTLADNLLLKALYKFYDSHIFAEQPDGTHFVFLTNRPFNPALVQVKNAINADALSVCSEVNTLYQHLTRYAEREKKTTIDPSRFRAILARTALVEYLGVDEVKANVQTKLQALGCQNWQQAHDSLFAHFSYQSTRIGGSTVTRESVVGALEPFLPIQYTLRVQWSNLLLAVLAVIASPVLSLYLCARLVPFTVSYGFVMLWALLVALLLSALGSWVASRLLSSLKLHWALVPAVTCFLLISTYALFWLVR